ncbi:MAG: trypsin-like peptidase domain-containing protein [bacterium]|nr:MAG: periplasmic serine protease, Do/DeqQ family [bacterium F083]MBR3730708.1 trypsin-like peptidase domain-containing protein [Bacteroidales bacterium]MDO5314552.1 trypsin-like peptidase domain-containing protein [bacterium]
MRKVSMTLMLAALLMAASCANQSQNANDSENQTEQQPVSQVEQVQQPQVQRAAFMPAQGTPDFVDAAERSVDAVVHIMTKVVRQSNTYEDFFGALLGQIYGYPGQTRNNTMVAYGSGVVLTPDGYIVTNNHVVEGADEVEVTFNNKVKKTATIIGTDPTTDLALIKVEASDLAYLTFGDSDNVRIGEWVLAVGNPFNLTSTVTAGIVSAKARNLSILGEGTSVESFIQTDAAVNPGNSGGALVNTKGELVGINAAIASHTGSYEGYSFAIPSNIVRKVVDDLLLYGTAQRGYLGVQIAELTQEIADKEGLENIEGVYVAEVTDGGAAKLAGLKSGDVITSINGKKVNSTTQLKESVGQYRPGDKIDVEVNRNGHHHHYDLTLLNEAGNVDVVKKGDSFYNSEFGLMLQPIDQNDMSRLNIKNGLKIVEIRQGRFMNSGVPVDFVITKVNGVAVNDKTELENALKNKRSRRTTIEGVYPNGMNATFYY